MQPRKVGSPSGRQSRRLRTSVLLGVALGCLGVMAAIHLHSAYQRRQAEQRKAAALRALQTLGYIGAPKTQDGD